MIADKLNNAVFIQIFFCKLIQWKHIRLFHVSWPNRWIEKLNFLNLPNIGAIFHHHNYYGPSPLPGGRAFGLVVRYLLGSIQSLKYGRLLLPF